MFAIIISLTHLQKPYDPDGNTSSLSPDHLFLRQDLYARGLGK